MSRDHEDLASTIFTETSGKTKHNTLDPQKGSFLNVLLWVRLSDLCEKS